MKVPPQKRFGGIFCLEDHFLLRRPFLLKQCLLTQEQLTLVLPLATIIANLCFS